MTIDFSKYKKENTPVRSSAIDFTKYKKREPGNLAQQVIHGVGSSGWTTARGAFSLAQKALDQTGGRLGNLLSGKGFTPTNASERTKAASGTNPFSDAFGRYIEPKTGVERGARIGTDIAQFLMPAGKVDQATKVLSVVPRVAARVAPDVALTAAQSAGGLNRDVAAETGVAGLTSAVGNALLPGKPFGITGTVLRNAASGYTADVATGLTGGRGKEREGERAFIPGAGTALAGAIGAVQFAPQIRQARQEKAVNHVYTKRYETLGKLQNNNKPLNKLITAADKSGVDTKRMLAESDLLVNTVDNTGTINTKASVQDFDDMLRPYEGAVGEALKTEGKVVPIEVLKEKMLSTIDDSGLVGGMKQTAKSRALAEIDAIALDADVAGNVPLKLVHDLKVQTNKTNAKSFIDPEKNAIGKVVGRGLKEFVEESTDALDVKKYNAELRKLYAVRDVLEGLNGKKVEGGRLGKYFAQTVGAVAGSAVGGPIGAVVGAEVGSFAKGAQMTRAFGGAQGNPIRPSQEMLDALKTHMRGTRQMSQANTKTPITNAIDTTVPQLPPASTSVMPKATGSAESQLTDIFNRAHNKK